MRRFALIACQVLWREFAYCAAASKNAIDLRFLRQGLHNQPDELRTKLQEAVDEVDENTCEAVLMGYGLCCKGLSGIKAGKIPLVLVRAHDCVTFLLGSKEKYRSYFDGNPGAYWYSSGWIETSAQPGKERFESTYRQYLEKYGEDNARFLMETEQGWMTQYSKVAYVDTGLGDGDSYRRYSRECAEWLGWGFDELAGDLRLIRNLVDGDWPEKDFLVLRPGQTLAPSHDEAIIKAT